jgi:four helix bundle protein
MKPIDFNNQFRERTKSLTLMVLKLYSLLIRKDETRIIGKQLIRSCSSVGANFRASCIARSKKEQYAKLCIVVEEADETLFWLELLRDGGYVNANMITPLYTEALEISKVMATSRKTLKSKLPNKS